MLLQTFFEDKVVLRDRYRIADREQEVVMAGMFNKEGALGEVLDVRSRKNGDLLLSIHFEDGLLKPIYRAREEQLEADYHAEMSEMNFIEQPLDTLYSKIMSYLLLHQW